MLHERLLFDKTLDLAWLNAFNSTMRRPNIAILTIFAEVASCRSFRTAARNLGLSPSAVSHAIGKLETQLGVRLLGRTTRSVAVTDEGRQLIEQIEPALTDINQAMQALVEARGVPAGRLRVTVPRVAAQLIVGPQLGPFGRAYPLVELELSVDDAIVDIIASGFDIGIRLRESLAKDMVATPIGPDQKLVAIAAPALFALHGKPEHPKDLLRFPCIRTRFESGSLYDWEFEKAGRRLKIAVSGPLIVNDDDLLMIAARAGLGIAFTFEGMAQQELKNGALVQVLSDWCPIFPGFSIYYSSRRQIRPAVRAFVDFMK